jgi:hypothetical protein
VFAPLQTQLDEHAQAKKPQAENVHLAKHKQKSKLPLPLCMDSLTAFDIQKSIVPNNQADAMKTPLDDKSST